MTPALAGRSVRGVDAGHMPVIGSLLWNAR
jgi:hypothetical protein